MLAEKHGLTYNESLFNTNYDKKTFVITDPYCLRHAGFENYANVMERVKQKDSQPENAERLMVLMDQDKGVLTRDTTITADPRYELKESVVPANIGDVLKVHDYRYIKTVIAKCQAINPDWENLARYDRDSSLSSESWNAALLSAGAIIEACDKVMLDEYKNGFCAVRPPGHHAGIFGSTFKDNVCD